MIRRLLPPAVPLALLLLATLAPGPAAQSPDEAVPEASPQDSPDAPPGSPEADSNPATPDSLQETSPDGTVAEEALEEEERGLWETLDARFRALAQEHPERLSLERVGTSRGGRAIEVGVLHDPASGAPETKPGLLVFGRDDGPGSRAALIFAERLLADGGSDPRLAGLLENATLYVAPMLDPDAVAPALAGADSERFERNFPLGWLPSSMRPGGGDLPLSRPATLAAARFLARQPNLVALFGPCPDPRSKKGPSSPEHGGGLAAVPDGPPPVWDLGVLARLTASMEAADTLEFWDPRTSTGGGFFDFAYGAHGIFPVAWCAGGGEPPAVEDLVERTIDVARALPRVVLSSSAPARLGVGLWQIDVELENRGGLPTMSELGMARRSLSELSIGVHEARLVATAFRVEGESSYRVAGGAAAPAGVAAGRLAAGESRSFRLVVEADAGSRFRVDVAGPWVGVAALDLELATPGGG